MFVNSYLLLLNCCSAIVAVIIDLKSKRNCGIFDSLFTHGARCVLPVCYFP